MTTLADALGTATAYWDAKGRSSRMMAIRATLCVGLLGSDLSLAKLGAIDGTTLLTKLRQRGLGRASERSYYAAFRRMLTLSGKPTYDWPKAGAPLRRVRDPLTQADLKQLKAWLIAHGYGATAALADVLSWTGMRVEVEALRQGAVVYLGDALRVTGKGGHERLIPVGQPMVTVKQWLEDARKVPYATHLDRWNKAIKALGITTRKPTPHAVRHMYATEAYKRSGGNLMAVKELLGHADVGTTAGYIGVDLAELRTAAGCDPAGVPETL